MLTFTRTNIGAKGQTDSKVYQGFCRFDGRRVEQGMLLAVVWFDGEPDMWWIDGLKGLDVLRRFYADEWGADRVTKVDTFMAHTAQR